MPTRLGLPPLPEPRGHRRTRALIASTLGLLVLGILAPASLAATPSAADVQAFLAAHGLSCRSSPEPAGGIRYGCENGERNEFGMAALGAQYVIDPTGSVTIFSVETATQGLTPPTGRYREFLVSAAALRCDDDPAELEAFIVENGSASTDSGSKLAPAFAGNGCLLHLSHAASGRTDNPTINQSFLSILGVEAVPGASASDPEAPATPGPGSSTTSGPVAPGGGPRPSSAVGGSFASSVPRPTEVSSDPLVLAQSALLTLALLLLMPFPGQLFNSTFEAHEDEIRRSLRLDRLRAIGDAAGGFWRSWPGVAVFTAIAAALYALLDPSFGLDLRSLSTYVGMLAGIVVVTLAFALPAWVVHGRAARPSVKVVPLSLGVGVVCVAISRVTGFQPGYLYGLLIGLAFARELSVAEEARVVAASAALMLVGAFAAWIGLAALPPGDEASFAVLSLRTALAAVLVAGLEGVAFGLLPFRFLPGEALFAGNRLLWAALLGAGVFAFFHVLINPASGYLADTSRTPLLTTLALFVGFGLGSVAFWGWFRFRPSGDPARQPPET